MRHRIKLIIALVIALALALYLVKPFESFLSSQPKIHLITQFYVPDNEDRKKEIVTCLENNINNKYIDKIILFVEKDYDELIKYNDPKITLVNTLDRLSFKMAFEYANTHISINEDVIYVLANSDIYYDDTIIKLYEYNFDKNVLALTRIEEIKNNKPIYYHTPSYSQDTWIWKNNITIKDTYDDYNKDGIIMGIRGCDNRIAYIIQDSGYDIKNKYKLINTVHLHKNDYRPWVGKPGYGEPYKFFTSEY
jgi:hypothetical protein